MIFICFSNAPLSDMVCIKAPSSPFDSTAIGAANAYALLPRKRLARRFPDDPHRGR